jgi:hypothetical protein
MSAVSSINLDLDYPRYLKATHEAPDVIDAAREVMMQGLGLLFQLNDQKYSRIQGLPFHASIGQLYRNVLEHFQCLVWGLRSGEINYEGRERNQRLQSEVSYACIATCDVLRALKRHATSRLSRECRVTVSMGYETQAPTALPSNLECELAYCVRQAIQHYTIIRMLCVAAGISVPDEFGKLPAKGVVRRAADLPSDFSGQFLAEN